MNLKILSLALVGMALIVLIFCQLQHSVRRRGKAKVKNDCATGVEDCVRCGQSKLG